MDHGAARSTEHPRLYWGGLLTFFDLNLETNYWESQVEAFLKQMDRLVYVVGAIFTLSGLGRVRGKTDGVFSISFLLALMAVWTALIWWTFCSNKSYLRWRTWCVSFVRIGVLPLSSYRRTFLPPPDETTAAVLIHMMVKSNVLLLFSLPFALQIKFRTHLWLHAFCTAMCTWFVPVYCSAWLYSDSHSSLVREIRSRIEAGLRILMTLSSKSLSPEISPNDSDGTDCFLVFAFCMWTLGYLLPCACVYSMELHSRILYLMSGTGPNVPVGQELWNKWRGGVLVSFWTLLVCALLLYPSLCMLNM